MTGVIRHARKQKNTIDDQEKNQSIETDSELTQIFKLANKYIKINIKTEHFLKTQIELIEMKTKVCGVKDIPDWVDSRLNIANEMNSELEDIE